jgi:hypothetical protein
MSLTKEIKTAMSGNLQLARRPAQVYTSAVGAYNIFRITGPIEVISFAGLVTAAAGGATTVTTTFNGVAGDAGAVAINGAVGTVVYIPLNVAGALLNAAAIPKTVATLTSMLVGTQPAGVWGTVVLTFGVSTWTGEWLMQYRKLSPLSRVITA